MLVYFILTIAGTLSGVVVGFYLGYLKQTGTPPDMPIIKAIQETVSELEDKVEDRKNKPPRHKGFYD